MQVFVMTETGHDLILFLGRFHPLLVHLPIGGLILVGLLEVLARFSHFQRAAQNRQLLLGVVALSSLTAAAGGWLLSQSGGYDAELLRWHKWTGLAFAGVCTTTWLLSLGHRARAYQLSLAGALGLLVVASHLGGSITHGRDFLVRFAPAPLRRWIGGETLPATTEAGNSDSMSRQVFNELVQPILKDRCSACHGAEKHKSGLRLDSWEAVGKGGSSGPIFVAGQASDSHIIQRLLLPLSDDDHMPPEGKPQPTRAEIELIQWWIKTMAPAH